MYGTLLYDLVELARTPPVQVDGCDHELKKISGDALKDKYPRVARLEVISAFSNDIKSYFVSFKRMTSNKIVIQQLDIPRFVVHIHSQE
ncbi:predicted protein [Sclerotinia sclerotiorum 1980 UF-70]|uniref:Uncharacterized protein n=1 Tax=Sclerotinia sclerotiorum (strain ATCC 18683 / 1980 / Ss-1) TaxID=665079 RepID=A7E5I7_SCLS1|nr:predicted protein [Sclerotinia sclerotiorum 1980 UF-70]EDN91159.1 predicted protein [Sclerotinia sclerotiorum 1980 UF-70]